MNFQTERLNLEEITRKDIDAIHQLHCFPQVAQHNTIGIPENIAQTEELHEGLFADQQKEERSLYKWAIRLKTSHEFVGEMGLNLSIPKYCMGEIHYSFVPTFWGKGYATEAAHGLINLGFGRLKLHRIEAGVATDNHASIRLLEKIGMTREGIRRKILPIGGEWKDNYQYAILEEDLRNY